MGTSLTLTDVMKAAIGDAVAAAGAASEQDLEALPTRFPVQVGNSATRVFLEYQAKALNTSIAGLAGTILDQVVANTLKQQREAPNS